MPTRRSASLRSNHLNLHVQTSLQLVRISLVLPDTFQFSLSRRKDALGDDSKMAIQNAMPWRPGPVACLFGKTVVHYREYTPLGRYANQSSSNPKISRVVNHYAVHKLNVKSLTAALELQ